jgi:hypothetical protein
VPAVCRLVGSSIWYDSVPSLACTDTAGRWSFALKEGVILIRL